MRLALDEAALAAAHGDVPVGAVALGEGRVIASRHNERERRGDPTAHAEVLALRDAARAVGGWRLHDVTLVVTLEPCAMCAGALRGGAGGPARLRGARPEGRGLRLPLQPLRRSAAQPRGGAGAGVLAAECGEQLTAFFAERGLAAGLVSRPEACESGRIGWSRKPLCLRAPWVQIPPPPRAARAGAFHRACSGARRPGRAPGDSTMDRLTAPAGWAPYHRARDGGRRARCTGGTSRHGRGVGNGTSAFHRSGSSSGTRPSGPRPRPSRRTGWPGARSRAEADEPGAGGAGRGPDGPARAVRPAPRGPGRRPHLAGRLRGRARRTCGSRLQVD